jgi:Dynamin family
MEQGNLAARFEAYSAWRGSLSHSIIEFRRWLQTTELLDPQTDLRLKQLTDRLAEDKLIVAFVAEFSRGKTELINAIFFASYGQRLLPSSAGRTTMCPTELLYDKNQPVCIKLLPVETRASSDTLAELRARKDAWTVLPLDLKNPESMALSLGRLQETKRVDKAQALEYALFDPNDPEAGISVNDDGSMDIPAWRHAIINFPHPLLEEGLVILDTPGLNAIGLEPELTLNLLPSAHAVLFLLAAETGVTRSDIDVWVKHLGGSKSLNRGRIAVLNKIDGLWDELKTEAAIEAELDKQISYCAGELEIDRSRIFPVSAQKGLLAKIQHNIPLLEKSRLPHLEKALAEELLPAKQEIVRDQTKAEIDDLMGNVHTLLRTRLNGVSQQYDELHSLQGKNKDVVDHMLIKVQESKAAFERGLKQFQALRSVFSQHSANLLKALGMDRLRVQVKITRHAMISSHFSKGLRDAMGDFFLFTQQGMERAAAKLTEIRTMMEAMYQKLEAEHGLEPVSLPPYTLDRYIKELKRLEITYDHHFSTINLVTTEQHTLTARFFDTIARRAIEVFESANRHTEQWLRATMAPVEIQIREHQMQYKRRLDSIRRIQKATDTLDDKVEELEESRTELTARLQELETMRRDMENGINASLTESSPAAAAATA